jgi:hypothetical protein
MMSNNRITSDEMEQLLHAPGMQQHFLRLSMAEKRLIAAARQGIPDIVGPDGQPIGRFGMTLDKARAAHGGRFRSVVL